MAKPHAQFWTKFLARHQNPGHYRHTHPALTQTVLPGLVNWLIMKLNTAVG